MQIAPAGDRALLVELGGCSAAELHAAARSVRTVHGVLGCIAGYASLYVVFDDPAALERAHGGIAAAVVAGMAGPEQPPARVHRLRVRFDDECGPDLQQLTSRVGREAFLARVATLRLTVRYLGFRGGFGYLDGWPPEWAMPRRPTSRPLVRRGTFGVAGGAAGFYPVDSPGGWNLLGRTDSDLEHALRPGDEIRIEPADVPLEPPQRERSHIVWPFADQVAISAAPLARLVGAEDWSRVDEGVAVGGPFDPEAAALCNLAAGRPPDAPLVECAIAGPRLRFLRDCAAAWCGPDLTVRRWRAGTGEEVALGRIVGGLRGYLAVGSEEGAAAAIERRDRLVIDAMAGPHDRGLREVECEVTPHLDRVGIRLRPLQPIAVAIPADLPSCGMQCGTVQLHPDGSLVVMGPDHPVTGGYLQPMTVLSRERWKLAQLRPGERVLLAAVR